MTALALSMVTLCATDFERKYGPPTKTRGATTKKGKRNMMEEEKWQKMKAIYDSSKIRLEGPRSG